MVAGETVRGSCEPMDGLVGPQQDQLDQLGRDLATMLSTGLVVTPSS